MKRVLAIDPGMEKCGFAVVESPETILDRQIVFTPAVKITFQDWLKRWKPEQVLLGNGTYSKAVRNMIEPNLQGIPLLIVDEHDSTYRARKLYFHHNPPQGLWRFIPLGLQVPPKPYDDFAAALLALRYLKTGDTPGDVPK